MHSYVVPNEPSLATLVFTPVTEMVSKCTLSGTLHLDNLWHAGWFFFSGRDNPRHNWSGFMQEVGEHLPPGDIRMLQSIDMNPVDKSCMISTLLFIKAQAEKLNLDTPCVTFD